MEVRAELRDELQNFAVGPLHVELSTFLERVQADVHDATKQILAALQDSAPPKQSPTPTFRNPIFEEDDHEWSNRHMCGFTAKAVAKKEVVVAAPVKKNLFADKLTMKAVTKAAMQANRDAKQSGFTNICSDTGPTDQEPSSPKGAAGATASNKSPRAKFNFKAASPAKVLPEEDAGGVGASTPNGRETAPLGKESHATGTLSPSEAPPLAPAGFTQVAIPAAENQQNVIVQSIPGVAFQLDQNQVAIPAFQLDQACIMDDEDVATKPTPSFPVLDSDMARKTTISRKTTMTRLALAAHNGRHNMAFQNEKVKSFVNDMRFDYFVFTLIITNAMLIGAQAQHQLSQRESVEPLRAFRLLDLCFCVAFASELFLRMGAFGCKFFIMQGWRWNVFDTILVSLQLLEEALAIISTAGQTPNMNMSFLRVLRVLRLVRLLRLARIMRLIGELRTLVTSIMASLKCLMWTLVLVFLMIYTVSVYICQVVAEHLYENNDHPTTHMQKIESLYGSLPGTFLTLFQCITGGIDWRDAVQPLMDDISVWVGPCFCVYIAFAVLAMLNVITGVFVESSLKSAKNDTDVFMISNVREAFKNACKQEDDGSQGVSWEAFQGQLDQPHMQAYFKAIDVDPSEARGLFRLIDLDGSGSVDFEEFLSGCLRLRGPAKSLDLQLLMSEVRRVQMLVKALAGDGRCGVVYDEKMTFDVAELVIPTSPVGPRLSVDATMSTPTTGGPAVAEETPLLPQVIGTAQMLD